MIDLYRESVPQAEGVIGTKQMRDGIPCVVPPAAGMRVVRRFTSRDVGLPEHEQDRLTYIVKALAGRDMLLVPEGSPDAAVRRERVNVDWLLAE